MINPLKWAETRFHSALGTVTFFPGKFGTTRTYLLGIGPPISTLSLGVIARAVAARRAYGVRAVAPTDESGAPIGDTYRSENVFVGTTQRNEVRHQSVHTDSCPAPGLTSSLTYPQPGPPKCRLPHNDVAFMAVQSVCGSPRTVRKERQMCAEVVTALPHLHGACHERADTEDLSSTAFRCIESRTSQSGENS